MYSAVSAVDAIARFLNEETFDFPMTGIADDPTFGLLIVKIADRLEQRLARLGWKTMSATGQEPEALAATSIRCLRSLGPAFQCSRGDTIVHQQTFFTLLAVLTSLVEDAERHQIKVVPRPVRVRRFLSSPVEIPDPHAPLEIGETIGT